MTKIRPNLVRRYYEKEEKTLLVVDAISLTGQSKRFPLSRCLWLRAFNRVFRLGWGLSPFLAALALGFSAHHNPNPFNLDRLMRSSLPVCYSYLLDL